MEKENARIEAGCRYFVCRECRTKVGWRHQAWCSGGDKTVCTCADCFYRHKRRGGCTHPALKKEGRTGREKVEYPL